MFFNFFKKKNKPSEKLPGDKIGFFTYEDINGKILLKKFVAEFDGESDIGRDLELVKKINDITKKPNTSVVFIGKDRSKMRFTRILFMLEFFEWREALFNTYWLTEDLDFKQEIMNLLVQQQGDMLSGIIGIMEKERRANPRIKQSIDHLYFDFEVEALLNEEDNWNHFLRLSNLISYYGNKLSFVIMNEDSKCTYDYDIE